MTTELKNTAQPECVSTISPALMQDVWRSLTLAMAICDAVPTLSHETDGPLSQLGALVNNVNGAHGYAFIRDTLAALERSLTQRPAAREVDNLLMKRSEREALSPSALQLLQSAAAKLGGPGAPMPRCQEAEKTPAQIVREGLASAQQATPEQFADASNMVAPVALRSVHLTRDTAGMCVVRINGRVAIRDNGDIIDHMATLEWFADTQQATPTTGNILTDAFNEVQALKQAAPSTSGWIETAGSQPPKLDWSDAPATPEPVGEPTDAFPPMPEGWPARFRCDSCDGNGVIGEPMSMGHFQPPEQETCPDCGGCGWASEEPAFNAAHMREFAEAHARHTHPAPGVPDVDDLRDRLVAISTAVTDSDDRAAQSMLREALALLAAQAKGGV